MRRLILVATVVMMFFGLCMASSAKNTDLKTVISGEKYPLAMKLSQLDSNWSQFTLPIDSLMGKAGQMMSAYFGQVLPGQYFTRWDTESVGGTTFLVAYQVKQSPFDARALDGPGMMHPGQVTPDTEINLALLNVDTISGFTEIQKFNLDALKATQPEESPFEGAQQRSEASASVSNLKQLALGMLMYTQDWDQKLPPMQDYDEVKQALMPYVKTEKIFVQPGTDCPYGVNTILSEHMTAHIEYPSSMVVFYELDPSSDGLRAVAFLDGHVKRLTDEEWQNYKKISKIP